MQYSNARRPRNAGLKEDSRQKNRKILGLLSSFGMISKDGQVLAPDASHSYLKGISGENGGRDRGRRAP
jgi:hypothetical protein